MKWMVAGAGALLSLAGAYALITGSSIVQVERGWSMVIAGAVILAAGAVLLGMAAVMAKMEQLARAYLGAQAPAFAHRAFAPAPEAPPVTEEPTARRRFARAPAPPENIAVEPEPAPAAVEPPSAPARVAEAEPAGSPGLRDFQFVFPPAEPAPEPPAPEPAPAPVRETARVEPLRPPRPAPSPAASRFASQWLRRNKEAPAAPSEPVEPPAPEPESQREPELPASAEPQAAFVVAQTNVVELRVEAPAVVAAEEQAQDAAPSADIEPPAAPVEPAADPFSPDWLERAIAAGEAEAAALIADHQESAPASRDGAEVMEAAPADEPAVADFEPAPAASEEPMQPVERTPTPAPVEIGRYKANDVAYVMYADGSITAETPAGASYRFSSLLELRKFIEKGGA